MSVLPPSIHPHPQWIFTPSELLNNPSTRLSSVPFHAELEARNAACRWAGRLTMSLHRDNDCHFIAATACIFIQRTYMRFTVEQFPPRELGSVALFLAFKDCERATRLKNLVKTIIGKLSEDNRKAGHPPGPPSSEEHPEFRKWQDYILTHEEILADALCWEFIPALPYEPYCHGVRRMMTVQHMSVTVFKVQQHELLASFWFCISDSATTPVAILQPPTVIAAAAWVIAQARVTHVSLADAFNDFDEWKRHFGIQTESKEDVEQALLWMKEVDPKAFKGSYLEHRRPAPLDQLEIVE